MDVRHLPAGGREVGVAAVPLGRDQGRELDERKRVRMFAGLIKGQADVSAYAERLLDEDYEVTGR